MRNPLMLVFYFMFILVIISSCNKISITVSGSYIPSQKLDDSIFITIDKEIHLNNKIGYYLLDRQMSFNYKLTDSSYLNVLYPKIGYSKKIYFQESGHKYLKLKFFFDDSLINKYVVFDSLNKYHPEKMKFEAILSE